MDKIPDENTIIRSAKGRHVEQDGDGNDVILGPAFIGRPSDAGKVSYDCLEMHDEDTETAVQKFRDSSTLKFTSTYRLVTLNVGTAISNVNSGREDNIISEILHDPVEADEEKETPENPAHCVMTNIPEDETSQAQVIGEILSDCVEKIYLAKPDA